MYKLRNQQRRTSSFKYLQSLLKQSKSLLQASTESQALAIMSTMRKEAQKAGGQMWSYLRVKFFEPYAACTQAILARVDTICMRVEKLIIRGDQSGVEK
jgi:hypothetical protein